MKDEMVDDLGSVLNLRPRRNFQSVIIIKEERIPSERILRSLNVLNVNVNMKKNANALAYFIWQTNVW